MDVEETCRNQAFEIGGVDVFARFLECGDEDVDHYACEAGDAEVVEWVEENDCCILAG